MLSRMMTFDITRSLWWIHDSILLLGWFRHLHRYLFLSGFRFEFYISIIAEYNVMHGLISSKWIEPSLEVAPKASQMHEPLNVNDHLIIDNLAKTCDPYRLLHALGALALVVIIWPWLRIVFACNSEWSVHVALGTHATMNHGFLPNVSMSVVVA